MHAYKLQMSSDGPGASQQRCRAVTRAEPAAVRQRKQTVRHTPPPEVLRRLAEGSNDASEPPPMSTTRTRPSSPPSLPPESPAWLRAAYALSASLDDALRNGIASRDLGMRIEHAWEAWQIAGTDPQLVAAVAHVVASAHAALHTEPPSPRKLHDCALVLFHRLPDAVQRKVDAEAMLGIVRELERDVDQRHARTVATARLMGWTARGLEAAERFIDAAIEGG